MISYDRQSAGLILPTFIIAGAPRAGTTWLYQLLDHHPDVYMARPAAPEPKFFLVDDQYRKGLDYYSQKYFAPGAGRAALGEKSTNYLEGPGVAGRIHRAIPNVKLIFALRDPIERAYSNYLWSRKNGLETLSFEEALQEEQHREASYPPQHRYSRPFSYISRGMYAALLNPYLRLFPQQRIKIVLLDDIESDPRFLADDLYAFVGVSPVETGFDFTRRVNSARRPAESIGPAARDRLREIYRRPNRDLAELTGRDLSRWGATSATTIG